MCETKAFVVWKSLILLVAASFFIYQAHTEKKRDTIAKSKVLVLRKQVQEVLFERWIVLLSS